jgi:hypothetical protein
MSKKNTTEAWRMELVKDLMREQGFLVIGSLTPRKIGTILRDVGFMDIAQRVTQPFAVIAGATVEELDAQRALVLKLRPRAQIYEFPEDYHLYKVRTD